MLPDYDDRVLYAAVEWVARRDRTVNPNMGDNSVNWRGDSRSFVWQPDTYEWAYCCAVIHDPRSNGGLGRSSAVRHARTAKHVAVRHAVARVDVLRAADALPDDAPTVAEAVDAGDWTGRTLFQLRTATLLIGGAPAADRFGQVVTASAAVHAVLAHRDDAAAKVHTFLEHALDKWQVVAAMSGHRRRTVEEGTAAAAVGAARTATVSPDAAHLVGAVAPVVHDLHADRNLWDLWRHLRDTHVGFGDAFVPTTYRPDDPHLMLPVVVLHSLVDPSGWWAPDADTARRIARRAATERRLVPLGDPRLDDDDRLAVVRAASDPFRALGQWIVDTQSAPPGDLLDELLGGWDGTTPAPLAVPSDTADLRFPGSVDAVFRPMADIGALTDDRVTAMVDLAEPDVLARMAHHLPPDTTVDESAAARALRKFAADDTDPSHVVALLNRVEEFSDGLFDVLVGSGLRIAGPARFLDRLTVDQCVRLLDLGVVSCPRAVSRVAVNFGRDVEQAVVSAMERHARRRQQEEAADPDLAAQSFFRSTPRADELDDLLSVASSADTFRHLLELAVPRPSAPRTVKWLRSGHATADDWEAAVDEHGNDRHLITAAREYPDVPDHIRVWAALVEPETSELPF